MKLSNAVRPPPPHFFPIYRNLTIAPDQYLDYCNLVPLRYSNVHEIHVIIRSFTLIKHTKKCCKTSVTETMKIKYGLSQEKIAIHSTLLKHYPKGVNFKSNYAQIKALNLKSPFKKVNDSK